MNQKTNLFGGVTAERFFPATGANGSWDPSHEHILSIDLKEFGHQFFPALISMTDRAGEHSTLRFMQLLHSCSLDSYRVTIRAGTG